MTGPEREDEEMLHRRGRAERGRGEIERAIATFTEAHERFPEKARPLVQRGAALVLAGHHEEALADYRAAERLEPAYPGLRSYFAEVYLYLGRPEEALRESEDGMQAEPDDLMHRINRAHALLYLGRREEARALYLELAGERHPVKRASGAELVRSDFELLSRDGLGGPEIDAIAALLRDRAPSSEA